jgi:hypothetical protein
MKTSTTALAGLAFAWILAGCSHKDEVMPVATPSPEATDTPVTPVPAASSTAVPNADDARATQHYVVVKGDSLWTIASKTFVLGDSMQWPLLYRSNRDEIADPDLIDIGQDLTYVSGSTEEEISQAVHEAQETPNYVEHTEARKTLPLAY